MTVEEVIKRVCDLQQNLIDIDGLSRVYSLSVLTDGDAWSIMLGGIGITLIDSEIYDNEDDDLEEQIIDELKSIYKYLKMILKK
jgi:hypothetical protein